MINADDEASLTASTETVYTKNLFAYCDNNPVSRIDDDGDFWHILVGAALGGIANSAGTIIDICLSKDKTRVDFIHLGIDFCCGAVTGAIAASTLNVAATRASLATMGGINEFANQAVDHYYSDSKFDSYYIVESVLTSSIGAKSYGTAKSIKAGTDTVRKTYKTFKSVYKSKGLKQAIHKTKGKAVQQLKSYYKRTKSLNKGMLKESINTLISSLASWASKFGG